MRLLQPPIRSSAVCGRICAKPCETDCRRGESDAPVAIRSLKRFVMDKLGEDYRLPEVAVTRSQTIGIVGGGPTGLTAAQDLAELGFEVHVYERSGQLGGMLYTIPAFRMPRNVVESDINRILGHCPGIKVHLNTGIGTENQSGRTQEAPRCRPPLHRSLDRQATWRARRSGRVLKACTALIS